jgi:flavin reductase (DIM6/NTAB) family NADH-FMN oxidoreductase RutF
MTSILTPVPEHFTAVGRQKFRRYFQPSRVVLALMRSTGPADFNVITLCFSMHSSYRPPMVAFAIQDRAFSHHLITLDDECVLAVPGESLVEETMHCGITSGRDTNKIKELSLDLMESTHVAIPNIRQCIANIELKIVARVQQGDHVTVFGEVLKYGVNADRKERPLLSVGPDERGYRVLKRHRVHRLAVVDY